MMRALVLALALHAVWIAHPTRTVDGDTFDARVELWQIQPGAMDPNKMLALPARIRLRWIDTPEIKGKCDLEKALAVKARDYLTSRLGSTVYLTDTAPDPFAGRTDANVTDESGADIGTMMIAAGHAVPMDKTRTKDWCATGLP